MNCNDPNEQASHLFVECSGHIKKDIKTFDNTSLILTIHLKM